MWRESLEERRKERLLCFCFQILIHMKFSPCRGVTFWTWLCWCKFKFPTFYCRFCVSAGRQPSGLVLCSLRGPLFLAVLLDKLLAGTVNTSALWIYFNLQCGSFGLCVRVTLWLIASTAVQDCCRNSSDSNTGQTEALINTLFLCHLFPTHNLCLSPLPWVKAVSAVV